MFARVSHWWSLKKLRQDKQRIALAYDVRITEAYRVKKKSDDIASIRDSRQWELRNSDDEIAALETDYYRNLADLLGVALPPFAIDENGDGDDWYRPQMFDRALLTRLGRAKLRSDIRKEKRERRDAWLPYISALTGLLGVVVAALAIIYNH